MKFNIKEPSQGASDFFWKMISFGILFVCISAGISLFLLPGEMNKGIYNEINTWYAKATNEILLSEDKLKEKINEVRDFFIPLRDKQEDILRRLNVIEQRLEANGIK